MTPEENDIYLKIRRELLVLYQFMNSVQELSTYNIRLVFVNDVDGQTKERAFMLPFFPATR